MTLSKQTILERYPTLTCLTNVQIYDTAAIGEHCFFAHNAVIREDVTIGDNVVIGVNSYIGPNTIIGNNTKVHTSCFLEGVTLGKNVIIAPHVVFTNDPYPPCRICTKEVGGAKVGDYSVIGANATILPGLSIGHHCIIGAGSVVTHDVLDFAVVAGNPARLINDTRNINHAH